MFSTFPKKKSPKVQKKVRIQENRELFLHNTGSEPCLTNEELFEKLETTFDKEEARASTPTSQPSGSPKSILKRSHDEVQSGEDSKAVAAGSSKNPKLKERLKSFNENIKTMAEKQMEKLDRARKHIKRIPLQGKEIVFQEKQKILRLKRSPKSKKHEFVSYLEKQDSDDTVDIVILDDSPSNARKHVDDTLVTPDEIIDLPSKDADKLSQIPEEEHVSLETQAKHLLPIDDEMELNFTEQTVPQIVEPPQATESPPSEKKSVPPKAPRKVKNHVYEDIEDPIQIDPEMLDFMGGKSGMMESLKTQDQTILKELKQKSEEEEDTMSALNTDIRPTALLAPVSSIDSTSSDDERDRRVPLPSLVEESDTGISDIECDVKPKIQEQKVPSVEDPIVKQEEIIKEEEKIEMMETKEPESMVVDETIVQPVQEEEVVQEKNTEANEQSSPTDEPDKSPESDSIIKENLSISNEPAGRWSGMR